MLKTEVWSALVVNRMKPLQNIETFLKRFNYFRDGEFRSVTIINPTTILIILAGQDEALAYDWKSIHIEFSGVLDAKLLVDTQYTLLDMSNGISLLQSANTIAFGVDECKTIASIKTSSCYIEATTLKYEENAF